MSTLVIVAYQCEVAGKRTGTVDYQVRHFSSDSPDEITDRLAAENPVAYKNVYGQNVRWIFDGIVATESNPKFNDGKEMIGFIAGSSKRSVKAVASSKDHRRRPRRKLGVR